MGTACCRHDYTMPENSLKSPINKPFNRQNGLNPQQPNYAKYQEVFVGSKQDQHYHLLPAVTVKRVRFINNFVMG